MRKLINKYFGNIELAIISIFIVVLPFIFSKKVLDPGLFTRYFVLSVVLLSLSIITLYKVFKCKVDLSLSKVEKIVFGLTLLFFINYIISSINAVNVREAVFHTFKTGGLMLFMFFVYTSVRSNTMGRVVIIKAFILATLAFLLIGTYQLTQSDFSIFFKAKSNYGYYLTQALWDVKSTMANKNPFSSFLYLSIPFISYGIMSLKKGWRIISIITLLLNIIFIGLMVSKTAWISLIVFFGVCVVLLFLFLFYLMPKQAGLKLSVVQNILVLSTPIVVVFSIFLFVSKSESNFANVIKDKVLQVVNPSEQLKQKSKDNPSSMEMRVIAWSKTFRMIEDNPILGVGPGHWRICFPEYGIDEFNQEIRDGVTHFQRPHNDFLWIAAEVGVLGLLIYLAIYLFVLYTAFRNFIESIGHDKRILNGLLFASLIGYIVVLAVSFSRERVPHNVISLAMFAIVLFDRYGNVEFGRKQANRKFVILIVGAILVFSIGNTYLSWQFYQGDKTALAIKYYKEVRKNWRMVLRSASKEDGSFYTLDPFGTPLSYYKGTAKHQSGDRKMAHKYYLESYSVHPNHLLVLNNLGTSYDIKGEHDKAIEYYEKALDISPRYYESLLNITIIYYNKKDPIMAMSYFSRIPYSEKQPERYMKILVSVCQQYAIGKHNEYDRETLLIWLQDENKIIESFVKFNQGNKTFDKILEEELGK